MTTKALRKKLITTDYYCIACCEKLFFSERHDSLYCTNTNCWKTTVDQIGIASTEKPKVGMKDPHATK